MSKLRRLTRASFLGYLPVVLALCAVWKQGTVHAQNPATEEITLNTGKEIFEGGCIACHGPDAKGMPRSTVGFDQPLPDFTDCNATVREPNSDWLSIIHGGGPARGFSEIMPSFTEALKKEQIEKVVEYLRGFCKESGWPRGELNLPRAIVTEKAFPEDEAVITTNVAAEGPGALSHEIVYEKRFGKANQMELSVPFSFDHPENSHWAGGVGDVALGMKRMLYHNLPSGTIFSVGGEVALPTGDAARGFGNGVTVFEPFAMFDQIFPADSFVQFQGGVELPTHTDEKAQEAFWRTAIGKTFTQGGGFGRMWTPMVEVLGARELETGALAEWDLLPQMQVTLSRRQHIRANFGVRVPVSNTAGRSTEIVFYLLWDWFDGGLREGW